MMTNQDAFDILNLPPDASLEMAKKAYRKLAKAHHPDRAGTDPMIQRSAEIQMTQINLAFRHLAPLLKSSPVSDKTDGPTADSTSASRDDGLTGADRSSEPVVEPHSSAADVFNWGAKLVERFWEMWKPHHKKPGGPGPKRDEKPSGYRTSPVRPVFRTPSFDTVFTQVSAAGCDRFSQKRNPVCQRMPRQRFFDNPYHAFMTLNRNRMTARSAGNRELSIGRVEKISPVKPVPPVFR